MDFSDLQCEKACLSIEVNRLFLPRVTVVREVQLEKAPPSIVVTPLGI